MSDAAIRQVRGGMLKHLSFVKRWGNPDQREAAEFWRQKLLADEEAEQPEVVNFATAGTPKGDKAGVPS
jgi:hypothetical protein